MATTGYLPTRDEMRVIAGAARSLYQVVRRWQKHAHLPGFPVERGNLSALHALFGLERALNPERLAWSQKGRRDLPVRNWGIFVGDGVAWLRRLLDLLMEKNKLESMATAPDFESWAAERRTMPQTVSIAQDEVLALRIAIRWLPRFDNSPDTASQGEAVSSHPRPAALLQAVTDDASVVLFSPRTCPIVLGRPKNKLTLAQFRVVKALLDAGDAGLCKARLQEVSGDAVNVLKRLAKADDDWGAVIHLAGSPGRGYWIGPPAAPDRPTLPHTVPSSPLHTTPHLSK